MRGETGDLFEPEMNELVSEFFVVICEEGDNCVTDVVRYYEVERGFRRRRSTTQTGWTKG
jgi:hypothetical protein